MKRLILAVILFAILALPVMSGEQFPPLEVRASGPGYNLTIASEVVLVDATDQNAAKFLQIVRDVLRRKFGMNLPTDLQVYRYTYTFISRGQYALKINLSEWEFIHSPFTDIIQDFSFVLKPGETKTFRFLSYGKPRVVTTPINVGIWKKDELYGTGRMRWNFAGIGAAGFYVPPPLPFWMALP